MKKIIAAFPLILASMMNSQTVKSPSGQVSATFEINSSGQPTYSIDFKRKNIINSSRLGLTFKDGSELTAGFIFHASKTTSFDETWQPVLGEVASIRNHYNELEVTLTHNSGKIMIIRFRAFDEGIAFRYEFPKQEKLNYFIVKSEQTQFKLTGDHKAFWIPGDFDSQEY